jgi:L-2,4-diaminobutyrate decarboxylase
VPAEPLPPPLPPPFPGAGPAADAELRASVGAAVDALLRHTGPTDGPAWSGLPAGELAALVARFEVCPDDGVAFDRALAEIEPVLAHGLRVTRPVVAGHLHCPTTIPSIAAEVLIAGTNQSLDSFDQAPAATYAEDHLVRWLGARLGLPDTRSGVLTSGGTASNLLGLHLARARAARRAGLDVAADGLGAATAPWRIVTSATAHFSIGRAAAVLGLGHRSVVTVPVDAAGRLSLPHLDATLARLRDDGATPVALVATAGTTDHGAIDPLDEVAARARTLGAWFHVDAAVGSALVLSDRLRPRLAGIEHADSVTTDFHKVWWQPIAASALTVADAAELDDLTPHSDYLHRAADQAAGRLNLVSRSLDTSRRFDALKVLLALRTIGRRRLAALVEHVVDLAASAAAAVDAHPDLRLVAPPGTVTVLFRWEPVDRAADHVDRVNGEVQRRLFDAGHAVVGRSRVGDRTVLKLTLVNPLAGPPDVDRLLALVATTAAQVDSEGGPR